MEEVTKIFFVVQQELQEQSKQINSRLEKISKEIQALEDAFSKTKNNNQKLLEQASPIEEKQIKTDIRCNQYLYDLELRKKMAKKTFYKNELQLREMYEVRCSLFINYMMAEENHNEIQITQSFYKFINYVYSEFIKKYQYERDAYIEKKNIHENYILCLSTFPTIDETRRKQIEKNIMTEEEYQNLIQKIKDLDLKLEEYKQIFKTKKPRITKKNKEEYKYFNFDVNQVVASIYPELQNDVQNQK